MTPDQNHSHPTQQGFTLIELAMVLLVVGFIIGPVISFMSAQADQEKYRTTVDRQKKIAIAMSDYAQKYGRLPCPGRPNDTQLGRPIPAGCNNYVDADHDGIVPYRALGLTQKDIIDGYGNPFTYAVSQIVYDQASSRNFTHKNCRIDSVWFPVTVPGFGVAIDPDKAEFCCASRNGNTILVQNAAGTNVTGTQSSVGADTALPTVPVYAPDTYSDLLLTYFAYTVISHGKNGGGAYILGSTARRTWTGTPSALEQENADVDLIFRDVPINTNLTGGNYFDDIVLWRTQETTIAETNSSSCARP